MSTIGERIRKLREDHGFTQTELAEFIGTTKQTIYKYETGVITNIPSDKVEVMAQKFEVTPAYIMGWDNPNSIDEKNRKSNVSAVFTDNIRMIPLFESVSAGFGRYACSDIIDYIPLRITSDFDADETICIRVSGDSMYPKIEDGDIIQVQRVDSVDSGSIAVFLLDGEEGLVKKVKYGKTWIELHSINPNYPVMKFKDAEVLRLRVVGLVKSIIKEI